MSGAGNGLDSIARFAGIQNALNQNALFQQTFAARQRAGQLIAAAPDLDTGIRSLFSDPLTAAFAGEIGNAARQYELTTTQIAREKQGMVQSGLGNTIKLLASGINDPSSLAGGIATGLGAVDPLVRDQVRSSTGSLVTSLTQGLPSDPAQASSIYKNRLIGMLLGSGMTPESLHEFTGTAGVQDLGGQRVPSVQLPAWLGPGFQTQSGAPTLPGGGLAMSPAPRVDVQPGPGGVPSAVQLGGQGGVGGVGAPQQVSGSAPGPGGNALAPAAPPPAAPLPSAPSTEQQTYRTERGKDMAGYQKALDDRVAVGTTIMQTVAEARDALGAVRTGGGATAYSRLAQLAQAFGAPQSTVDKISNGDLAASQEFSKLMVNTTMGQIREQLAGIGGSRLSQMEFKSFQENNPNLDTDPRAIDKIFNFWTKLYNRDSMEQQELGKYLADPSASLSQWPAHWQQIMRQQGIVRVGTEAAGSQGAVGGATHKWIPGQGLVPVTPAGSP